MSTSLRNLAAPLRDFINRPVEEEVPAGALYEIEYLLQSALETLYEAPAERAESREDGAETVRIATEILVQACV